ncbi:MAG: n-acetylmuramyl-l-alanine amidase, partial [Verrucomicrobiales bacterium]|nr:n-acetylmuramyl-l-alanine amidase [Verrucomicrobiales bacterium]
MKIQNLIKKLALIVGAAAAISSAPASTDYGPAVWRPGYPGHWYTTGVGKQMYVEHDMEGYYLSTISYLQGGGTSVSVHYCVNGKSDNGSDAAPGEVSQMVLDTYYAWHAVCLNTHSMSTEHEGFASNPAWYTAAMYDASAALTKSKAEKYGFAKDRNHIVGHGEWQNTAWDNWVIANLGFDPRCNSHTDPGPYWDWTGYMARINQLSQPKRDFSGDSLDDYPLFRPSTGMWYVRFGEDQSIHSFSFGQAGDIPLVAKQSSNDNGPDAVVFRPSTGTWYVRFSEDGSVHTFQHGQNGDIPLMADFSGDGKDDYAIFTPSTGQWSVRFGDATIHNFSLGQSGDIPLVAKQSSNDNGPDAVVFRPSTGTWYVRFSEDGS